MKRLAMLGVCVGVLITVVPVASATTLSYDLGVEFSGGTPPAGPGPWLEISFNDGGGTGSVVVTMSGSGLSGSEFVSGWYFNLNPMLDLSQITVTPSPNANVTLDSVSPGANSFHPAGAGLFDFFVSFTTSGSGGGRFQADESFMLTITGPGINANSFAFQSAPSGGNGTFFTAAHVQGIGANGALSGWIGAVGATQLPPPPQGPTPLSTPEPGTLALLGVGLAGGARALRKRAW